MMNESSFTSILYGIFSHLLTIGGFLLAVFLIARLMSEKKQPGNTIAWLLVIVLIPYVGVPLYLLFGGRKLRRLQAQKVRLDTHLPGKSQPASCAELSIAKTITSGGGFPPIGGNSLKPLPNGEDAFRNLEQNILQASECINIATFIIGRDEVGKHIIKLLAQRASEGIKVRLLVDSFGGKILSRASLTPITQAGGEVQWFMPVMPFASTGSANLRNHRKIALFDHRIAIVGGRNIAKEYLGPEPSAKRWTDFGCQIEGPAVPMLSEIFIADWCFASRQKPEAIRCANTSLQSVGDTELQIVASGPDVKGDPLYDGLVAMTQSSEKSITIITPYFIPDEVLLRTLIIKARGGREVTLILPEKSNHRIADFARKHYVRELLQAGVKVMLYTPGMLHSKATIVDGQVALFGSANCDMRSLFVNFEIGVVVHTEPEVRAINQWAESLLSSCKAAKPTKDYRFPRLSHLAEDLSRMFAPLL